MTEYIVIIKRVEIKPITQNTWVNPQQMKEMGLKPKIDENGNETSTYRDLTTAAKTIRSLPRSMAWGQSNKME